MATLAGRASEQWGLPRLNSNWHSRRGRSLRETWGCEEWPKEDQTLTINEQIHWEAIVPELGVTGEQLQSERPHQPKPNDRRVEMLWVERHRDDFSGQWVALKGENVISNGASGRYVYEEAVRAGHEIPFLVFVEPKDEPPFGGW